MTKRDKVRMYVEYTLGMTAKDLSSKYGVNVSNINYYIDLIKMHGVAVQIDQVLANSQDLDKNMANQIKLNKIRTNRS